MIVFLYHPPQRQPRYRVALHNVLPCTVRYTHYLGLCALGFSCLHFLQRYLLNVFGRELNLFPSRPFEHLELHQRHPKLHDHRYSESVMELSPYLEKQHSGRHRGCECPSFPSHRSPYSNSSANRTVIYPDRLAHRQLDQAKDRSPHLVVWAKVSNACQLMLAPQYD